MIHKDSLETDTLKIKHSQTESYYVCPNLIEEEYSAEDSDYFRKTLKEKEISFEGKQAARCQIFQDRDSDLPLALDTQSIC